MPQHRNNFVHFLRHYGPIATSDNMYDELIQTGIKEHKVDPPIHIEPAFRGKLIDNYESSNPVSVILTGTAGDGKTYHCRLVWEHFKGNPEEWLREDEAFRMKLPSGKNLVIVKDLSEIGNEDKQALFPGLSTAVKGEDSGTVYLIAANDGQLIASWRDWANQQGGDDDEDLFRKIESMLVENKQDHLELHIKLYNLSRMNLMDRQFEKLLERVLEHPQWKNCEGCELLEEDGTTKCPIRLNRELLLAKESIFRRRLMDLLRLSAMNFMYLPIRDLLLLIANILLGDKKSNQRLLTCRIAHNRVQKSEYWSTNPYASVLGANLPTGIQRQSYQVFNILESFGIGNETDNFFDNLLIYGSREDEDRHSALVGGDRYGAKAYEQKLRDYLHNEHRPDDFMQVLGRQRQRLFFTLPDDGTLNPWKLTVYNHAGELIKFMDGKDKAEEYKLTELLVKGVNRIFCGVMSNEREHIYLASSGGGGRGRIASILEYRLPVSVQPRDIYVTFSRENSRVIPQLQIVDPKGSNGHKKIVARFDIQLVHFEYLMRVAYGSLPVSFSRQCYEDLIDFKLRAIHELNELHNTDHRKISLNTIDVDKEGRMRETKIRVLNYE